METVLGIVRHSFRLHATIHAQTIHVALASNQRHPGNSRQTDFKRSHFNALRAFATHLAVCLSPASNGSNVLESLMS
jgi:hypothetical protein